MLNKIYLFVAILTFISWVVYVYNEGGKSKETIKRFWCTMQIIFLISNIICLSMVNRSEFFKSLVITSTTGGKAEITVGYILFGIPIVIYIGRYIFSLFKKEKLSIFMSLFWIVYIMLLLGALLIPPEIESHNVVLDCEYVVSYQEEITKATFLSDSIEGVDYIVKKQNPEGREEIEIIKTENNNKKVKVEIYPHQESSYIKKCGVVKTYITFWGSTYEQLSDKIIYKIYLTDEIYQKSK